MAQPSDFEPYVPVKPGDLITAEDMVKMQQMIRADIATNGETDTKNVDELKDMISKVDAPKFGGKTPDEWTDEYDKRYIKRDDPQAGGEYRRYFKRLNRQITEGGVTNFEPAIIKHNLCRYPLVEVYELEPLLASLPETSEPSNARERQIKEIQDNLDNWNTVKFLLYYANKQDPVSDFLASESADRFYWGDPLPLLLDQFQLKPVKSQAFADLLNDFWGKMFNPGDEQDEFDRDAYGNSPYTQEWIDKGDMTVEALVSTRRWDNIYVAIRPRLLAPGLAAAGFVPIDNIRPPGSELVRVRPPEVDVFHINQNVVEIRVQHAMDLMVLLRT